MSQSYYTKHGYSGLTSAGKSVFVLVFLVAGVVVWFVFVKPDLAGQGVQIEDLLTNMPVYAWAIIKITGGGLIAAYVAHFFLPKRKFYKQEFYCADCGEFLGYSITKCPRIECGSNRYTTDAELARRQSYKWQKKHRR